MRPLLLLLTAALLAACITPGPAYIPPDAEPSAPSARMRRIEPPLEEVVAFNPVPLSLIRDGVTAVGPGFTKSWAKTCNATTATTIVPAGVVVAAFECTAPQSTETDATQFVAIGDSLIGDPAFATRTSPVICGSGCAQSSRSINARQGYCRSDTDDVVIYCWGIVTNVTSQP